MATKKVKKFGRGGDILTGIGAVLAGKALYDKFSKDDSEKNLSTISGETRKPTLSPEVKKAQKSSEVGPIESSDERIRPKQVEQEDVRDKADAKVAKSEMYKAEPGEGYATPTDEKKLAKLQNRNVASPKKEAPRARADDLVGREYMGFSKVGKGYEGLGKEPAKSKSIAKDASPLPGKVSEKKEEPTTLPGKVAEKKEEPKKYGFGPYGAFEGLHRSLAEPLDKAKESQDAYRKKQADLDAAKAKAKKDRMVQYAKDHPVPLVNKRSGGTVKKYAAGGSVSASSRGDGIAKRGKTKGRIY